MTSDGPPIRAGETSLRASDARDSIDAIDQKRFRFHLLAGLALLVVGWVLFEAAPGPAFVVAILALVSTKKAWGEYRALAERREHLLSAGDEP